MINASVTYRVSPEFVEENKQNIDRFLNDFEKLDKTKFTYDVFLKDDGMTFVHMSSYADKEMQQKILNVPSFLDFQEKRDQSGLNNSHSVSLLKFVGSTKSPDF